MSYAVFNQLSNEPQTSTAEQNGVISTYSLIDQLSSAVQQVQQSTACCSTCDGHPLTNGNKDLKELCRVLNGLFSFGLINKSDSYWPVVKEFISKCQITEIVRLWQVQTPKGKSLAWLYHSLNEGSLEWQMRSFVDNFSILNKYYKKTAFMMDKQTLEMVAMYLRGLDGRQQKTSVTSNGCPLNGNNCRPVVPNDGDSQDTKECPSEHQRSQGWQVDQRIVKVKQRPSTIGKKPQTALYEQSVADFVNCPEVVGLSPVDTDKLLLDTELSEDALEFDYPQVPWTRLEHRAIVPRIPKVAVKNNTIVVKIVESNDHGPVSSMENSINDFSTEFNPIDVSSSTPITHVDADKILKAILSERRPSPEGSASPPRSTATKEPLSVRRPSTCSSVESSSLTPKASLSNEPKLKKMLNESKTNDGVPSDPYPIRRLGTSPSEGIPIISHKKDVDYTATPPNTFVPSKSFVPSSTNNNFLSSKIGNEHKKDIFGDSTDFEQRLIERIQKLNQFTDSISEKGSANSPPPSSLIDEKIFGETTSNGYVETAADPQTVLTQSGEVFLESGEILELTANVMKPGEQFNKMFRVFCNHHVGSPLLRYLLLSNSALYLLMDANNSSRNDNSKYDVDSRISYSSLDYISVGVNGQMLTIYMRNSRQTVVVCTASELNTRSILSYLELYIRRASAHEPNLQPPSVLTDATPQKVILNKWILGEIGQDDNVIHRYNFVYWNPNVSAQGGAPSGGPNRIGYLYMREFYPNGWLKKSTDWTYDYFILRGKKFYQFKDSYCKEGKKVFNLQDEIIGCRQTETKEHSYCIELVLQDDSVVVQLAAQTKHELQQWLHAFVASFSQSEFTQVSCSCVACCAVITNGFVLLGQETTTVGFVRTLALSRLDAISELKMSKKLCSLLFTVPSSTMENGEQWLLSFICESEMENFLNILKSLVNTLQCEELPDECDGEHMIRECFQHWTNVKQA